MTRLNNDRVEECIQESGMKLCALAGKLGTTDRNLRYRRKTGNWTIPMLCMLADLLYVPISLFFTSD